jgi:dihydrofolate synthase/folylpolyglutamate synthase
VTPAEEYIASLELMGMEFGLERMHALLAALDHPERAFDAIHVVGTNGKSSTVRFCEALLLAAGHTTGAYLSPHISSFRERIRVGGAEIDPDAYERAVLSVRDAAPLGVTQFEALTAAAFAAFAHAGVEWAVVEAGLGGRLDATNVLARSRVQVLTNVDLEHTQLLGDTRELIAAEKLAVVPAGGVVVAGEPGWDAFVPQAATVRVVTVDGSYQDQNRAVARAAVEAALGHPVDATALASVRVPGRLEIRGDRPLEIWDGAHNPAGMARLAAELPGLIGDRRAVAVMSVLADKDADAMVASIRPLVAEIVATGSSNPRVLPAQRLGELTGGTVEPDPHVARRAGIGLAGGEGAVLVCGSLYLLHDLNRPQTFADVGDARLD